MINIAQSVRFAIAAFLSVCLLGEGAARAEKASPTSLLSSPGFARHKRAAILFADGYRQFLGRNKTEREVVAAAVAMAREQGFKDLLANLTSPVKSGDRLYAISYDKLAVFVLVGRKPLTEGLHIVAAHVDAARIDLKSNPLYGAEGAARLDTHYYGLVQASPWLSLPLELRGVVMSKRGDTVKVAIGDEPTEPILVIPEPEPEPRRQNMGDRNGRPGDQGIHREALDPIISSTTSQTSSQAKEDAFAAEAARLLSAQIGIDVDDLAAAELTLVPAAEPRDVGLDRALIGGYGHNNRAGVYAALRALLSMTSAPEHTAIVMLLDREESGSGGSTGVRSRFLRRILAELLHRSGGTASELAVERVLAASTVLAASAIRAANEQTSSGSNKDRRSAAYAGAGIVCCTSDAQAELIESVRASLGRASVTHQAVAYGSDGQGAVSATGLSFFAEMGVPYIGIAIPVLSMHAPFELVAKADIYEAYRAYRAFLSD